MGANGLNMYAVLNKALRSDDPVCSRAVKNLSTVLSGALDKLSKDPEYTEARVLYRGLKYPDFNCDKSTAWYQMKVGEVFTTKSFWSTAPTKESTWKTYGYGEYGKRSSTLRLGAPTNRRFPNNWKTWQTPCRL